MARDRRAASRPLRDWLAGVQQGVQQGLAGALDLPRDAIRDLPRLTLIGQGELVVENHRGVAFFDQERVLVALGDVQGHSLHAATVMAELRHALRASLIDTVDPAHSMGLLNAVLRRYHPLITATVCLLLIAPATGEVELVNAGHIPPLLAGKDARYHPFGDLMLGVTDETYRVERLILPEDGTILLFTDGLIEDRDRMLDDGLETARRLAEDVVLGYVNVDFGFTDRPVLPVTLGVVLRRVDGTWLIAHYQVSRR